MFVAPLRPSLHLPGFLFPPSLFTVSVNSFARMSVSLCIPRCAQHALQSPVISVAACSFPALPARFIEDLRSQEATEGTTVTLRCQMSKAASVEWRKGSESLRDGDKYSLRQEGATCELQICGLAVEDAGEYSCVCGQERTSATLSVKGKDHV